MDRTERVIYGLPLERPYGAPLRGVYYELSTIMIIGTAISVIGTGLSVYSGYTQAQAQAASSRQAAAYAAAMAQRNQQIAEMGAQEAEAKGEYEANLVRMRARKLLGKQEALYGKAGVDLSGSPLDFMAQTSAEFERDAQAAVFSGKYEAWKLRTGGETSLLEGNVAASRYRQEADIYETRGSSALWGAIPAAGTTILTGFGRLKYPPPYYPGYQ